MLRRIFMVCAFSCSLISLAHAQSVEDGDDGDDLVEGNISAHSITPVRRPSGPNRFAIGGDTSSFTYREPGLMTDSGFMYGVKGQYDRLVESVPLKFSAEGGLVAGVLGYTGQKWDGTPLTDSTTDLIFNLRLLGAWEFRSHAGSFSPYVGIGYRYLNDNGQDSSSYEREISYEYLPIGARFQLAASGNSSFGVAVEYDYFLQGTVVTHLSQLGSNYPDLNNTQSSGEGYRLTANWTQRFRFADLRIEPYWQHWEIGNSDSQVIQATAKSVQSGMEPANSSDQIGLTVSILL